MSPNLTYAQAVDTLFGYTYRGLDPARLHLPDEDRPARAAALLAKFGDPQLRYPTVHITGTKGKGSVSAMTAAILRASGLRVGLLTSPHLQDVRERIRIDGALISRDDFARIVSDSLAIFESARDARFPECLNAVAFQYFAREQVDLAVIEVGIGGRLDATNVLAPPVCGFTSISYDHMHLLGDTLEAIATEKAGIIKPGCAVVSAPQSDGVIAVLSDRSAALGCPFTLVGRDLPFEADPPSRDGQGVTVNGWHYVSALIGAHQAINAATAIGICGQLRDRGYKITDDAIRDGLAGVSWPGRLEIVRDRDPLIVLDGAHNGESARRLRDSIESMFAERPRVLIYGSKANKDVTAVLRELVPIADHLILTRSSDAITQPAEALVKYAREAGYSGEITLAPDVSSAIDQASQIARVGGLVCLTGSLYLVGEARTVLGLAPDPAY